MAHITQMTPEGSEKNNRKPRPSTVYKRTIRSILQAYELAGHIAGCEEARTQLAEVAESIRLKMDLMKLEAWAAKKTPKAVDKLAAADETKVEETQD